MPARNAGQVDGSLEDDAEAVHHAAISDPQPDVLAGSQPDGELTGQRCASDHLTRRGIRVQGEHLAHDQENEHDSGSEHVVDLGAAVTGPDRTAHRDPRNTHPFVCLPTRTTHPRCVGAPPQVAGTGAVRDHFWIAHSTHSPQLPVVAGATVVVAIALLAVLVSTGSPGDAPRDAIDPSAPGSREPFSDPPEPLDVPDCATGNRRPEARSVERVATYRVPRIGASSRWLAYLPSARTLLMPGPAPEIMTSLTLFGDSAGQWPLPPGGAGQATVVEELEAPALGTLNGDPTHITLASLPYTHPGLASTIATIDLRALGLTEVTALDAAAGGIVLVDGGRRLVQARIAADRVTSACEVRAPAEVTFRAVATRVRDAHRFTLVSRDGGARLVETDVDGSEVAEYALPDDLARATAMVFAPSARPAASDAVEHLYLLTNSRGRSVIEVIAVEPEETRTDVPVISPEHVRTTSTAAWDPPSADPTGVAHDSARGVLLVTDSEVDERLSREEANVWIVTPAGGMREAIAFSPSIELTDAAVDLDSGRIFLADDGRKLIHVWEPGVDGLLGTPDDRTIRFSTSVFGCEDPEGLAFGQGTLFIADGAGRRVFRLAPGPNGTFEGIHPRSDDEVTSFDVGRLGLDDPEGIEYRPDRGTLLVMDREDAGPVLEVSTAGGLLRRYDLEGIGLRSPSGLAIGPSSDDPERHSLYIVDRGVDNAVHPGELDGQLVEVRWPGA